MRGPPPKPTWLKIISGNPGHRPLNHDEPRPVGNLDAPPDWMSASQQASWRYAIAHAPAGLLKLLDRSVLTIYIVAEDLHREAAKKVETFGAVIKKPGTGAPMQSPYVRVLNKQSEIMMRAASEMGFTPSSRSRVRVGASARGRRTESNRFADLKELDEDRT